MRQEKQIVKAEYRFRTENLADGTADRPTETSNQILQESNEASLSGEINAGEGDTGIAKATEHGQQQRASRTSHIIPRIVLPEDEENCHEIANSEQGLSVTSGETVAEQVPRDFGDCIVHKDAKHIKENMENSILNLSERIAINEIRKALLSMTGNLNNDFANTECISEQNQANRFENQAKHEVSEAKNEQSLVYAKMRGNDSKNNLRRGNC